MHKATATAASPPSSVCISTIHLDMKIAGNLRFAVGANHVYWLIPGNVIPLEQRKYLGSVMKSGPVVRNDFLISYVFYAECFMKVITRFKYTAKVRKKNNA